MSKLSYQQLISACEPDGAAEIRIITNLIPAKGSQTNISPTCYDMDSPVKEFIYETRIIDDHPTRVVIVDSQQEQLDRIVLAIKQAIQDDHPLLSRLPRIELTYPMELAIKQAVQDSHPVLSHLPRVQLTYANDQVVYTDLELPQRIYDHRILAGTVNGCPMVQHPLYRKLTQCHPENARELFKVSPSTLIFGAQDISRQQYQDDYRNIVVSEIVGVPAAFNLALENFHQDNAETTNNPTHSSSSSDQLTGENPENLSGQNQLNINKGTTEPSQDSTEKLEQSEGIKCSQIIRTQIIHFSVLQNLHFDCGIAGDIACRALLVAYALAGIVRANDDLTLRENCTLVEDSDSTTVQLILPGGDEVIIDPLTVKDVDTLLAQALTGAFKEADIHWDGQILHVIGDLTLYS